MAEPAWTDNPFAPPEGDAAPFADPSVAQASATMPEYDPFSDKPAAAAPVTTAPAAAAADPDTPDWAVQDQPKPSKKERKKSKKEKKQAAATQEEVQRQQAYDAAQAEAQNPQVKDPNYRPANWPGFPKGCPWPFKPCFHHDFAGEIPEWGYRATKHCYYIWLLYFLCLFWNIICNAAAMSTDVPKSDTSLGLAFAYFFIFAPLAYACWFQSLYQAMRKDSSLRFGWYFFTFMFQFIGGLFFVLGVPGTGASGIWVASRAVKDNAGVGIVMFTGAILFTLFTIYVAFHIRWVITLYRSSGQSIQKAQKEAVTGAVAVSMAN